MIKRAFRNIKKSHDLKEEASALFKKGAVQAAIDKFQDCLEIDELNIHYNATIYLNIGIGLSKLKKHEDALKALNRSVALNPNYAKAYVKRGEINTALEYHEEALRDFQQAH